MSLGLPISKQEVVDFFQSLVRTPSVNGVNDESEIANLVVEFAQGHGLTTEIYTREPKRPNVVVRFGSGKPKLLLFAHMDTVGVGRTDLWQHSPFGAEIKNGKLYGRGAADNKGGLVAALVSLIILQNKLKQVYGGSVQLICVPDEEAGATGYLSINYLIEQGVLFPCDAIYTYPGTNNVIIGHRGVLRLKIVTYGKPVHSGAMAWQNRKIGCNAVTAMSEILLALENLEFDTNRHDLFGSFRTVITPGTLIQGGTDKNVVPDYCEAMIDVRLVPSVSKSDIEERITSVINEITKKRKPLKVDIMPDVYIPCSSISPDSQIVTLIKETSKVLTGKDPRVTVSGPANESYLLNKFGIRTCIYGPNGGNFHGVDEFMELNSIFEVARIYASVAETLLTSQ